MTAQDAERPEVEEASIGELFGTLGHELADHLHTQVELAKAELREEAKQAGAVGGMFAGAAVAGYLALTLLAFAAAWGLAEVVAEGLAFLIVAIVVAAVAGVLAVQGKARLARMRTPLEETTAEMKEDVTWARRMR
jgi:uncharacterized membrane protein YqjE